MSKNTDKKQDDAPETKAAPEAKARYTMSKGRTMCTLAGVMSEGDAIEARDFRDKGADGKFGYAQKTIDQLVKAGRVIDNNA